MRRALALLALVLLPGLAHGQTTPIFRANFSASAGPLYGFDFARTTFEGSAYDLSIVAGAGPNGEDVGDITMMGVASPTEHYAGWFWDANGHDAPSPGARRVLRMKIRLVGPIRAQSVSNANSWSTKMVILGDANDAPGASGHRVMWNLRTLGGDTSNLHFVVDKNIDGPPSEFSYGPLPINEWISAQLVIDTGTGTSRFRLYINEDNSSISTPTAQSGLFTIDPSYWTTILGLGYYMDYMRVGGAIRYQFAAFEYDDEFDPDWHTPGAGDPAPTLSSISPASGPVEGGTAVTLTGTNFENGATVAIGANACEFVTVVSDTSITCTTPAGSAGAHDVTVTNPDTQSDTLVAAFTYTTVSETRYRLRRQADVGLGLAVLLALARVATWRRRR